MLLPSHIWVYVMLITWTLGAEIGQFPYKDYMADADFDKEVDEMPELRRVVRAARHCCLPWRAPCTLDESLIRKYSFLQCCNNGACRCNFLGSNCRCEARLG